MNALQPLLALLSQTERERDNALASLTRVTAQHQAAIEQTRQLIVYRQEYEARWSTHFKQASSIELVHCYRAFTERLAQAVAHQQQAEEHAERQREAAQALVNACEMRVASVQKLIERRLNEQRMHTDRREQQLTDEFAARVHWQPQQQVQYSNSTY